MRGAISTHKNRGGGFTVRDLMAELKGADPRAMVVVQFVRRKRDGEVTTVEAKANHVGWDRDCGAVRIGVYAFEGEE